MKRILLPAAVLAAVLVLGVVLLRTGRSDAQTPPSTATAPRPAEEPEPLGTGAPSPADAASHAVALTGEVVQAGLISRRDLIDSFTTADFGAQLAEITSTQVSSMHLALVESGDATAMSVAEFPLRTRTVRQSATAATVEVWSVIVVSRPSDAVARQMWRTVTVTLELVDDRWLVDNWESAEGPTPAGTPEGQIGDAGDVADRLAWDAASVGAP